MIKIFFPFCHFKQGARRIVSEWVDLDSEARQFTAKILGDQIDSQEAVVPPPDQAQEDHLIEDLESKAEL